MADQMDVQMDGYSSGEEEVARLRAGDGSDDSDYQENGSGNEGQGKDSDSDEDNQNEEESSSDSSVEEDEDGELIKVNKETYVPGSENIDEELEVDEKYYKLLYKATTTFPCMSFDVVPDSLGEGEERANQFPAALSLVGGTYSGKRGQDSLVVIKFSQLKETHKLQTSSEDEEEGREGEGDEKKSEIKRKDHEGKMRHVSIPHNGGINRVRTTVISKRFSI